MRNTIDHLQKQILNYALNEKIHQRQITKLERQLRAELTVAKKLNNVDWELLRKQRDVLILVSQECNNQPTIKDSINGITELLDTLLDYALDSELLEEITEDQ